MGCWSGWVNWCGNFFGWWYWTFPGYCGLPGC